MSAWKVGDPDPTVLHFPSTSDYCWAPSFVLGNERAVFCTWVRDQPHPAQHVHGADTADGPAIRAVWDAEPDGDGGYLHTVTPPPGRQWSPRETYPMCKGSLNADAWTDEMSRAGALLGINRQCSIGWHEECSDRYEVGDTPSTCRCACHAHEPGPDAEDRALEAGLDVWLNAPEPRTTDAVRDAIAAALKHYRLATE